jgi:hypothetical protein
MASAELTGAPGHSTPGGPPRTARAPEVMLEQGFDQDSLYGVRAAVAAQPGPSLPGGRGLWITRHLSDLQIVTSSAGTTMTASLTL